MNRIIMTDEIIEQKLRSIAQSLETELPRSIVVSGQTYYAVGNGNYPYECKLKDEYPEAMIYKGICSWVSEVDQCFVDRDRSKDCFEITAEVE